MSIAALFTMAKMWQQHECPLADEWINEMWYVPAVGWLGVSLQKEGHSDPGYHTGEPEGVTLSEIRRLQKDTCCMIPLL